VQGIEPPWVCRRLHSLRGWSRRSHPQRHLMGALTRPSGGTLLLQPNCSSISIWRPRSSRDGLWLNLSSRSSISAGGMGTIYADMALDIQLQRADVEPDGITSSSAAARGRFVPAMTGPRPASHKGEGRPCRPATAIEEGLLFYVTYSEAAIPLPAIIGPIAGRAADSDNRRYCPVTPMDSPGSTKVSAATSHKPWRRRRP